MKRSVIFLILCCLLSSCSTLRTFTKGFQYAQMYEEKPLTLLVMPPINNTSHPEAKEYLYTSISHPLAEAGYYVISPLLAMDVLKSEDSYEAEYFYSAPLNDFYDRFGADAVVFSIIDMWTKLPTGIQTNIRYMIRSTHTDEVLFDRTCNLYLDLSGIPTEGGGLLGLVIDVAAAAITTATTDHIEAAREANKLVFKDLPRGKYHPYHMKDMDFIAEDQVFDAHVKR